MIVPGGGGGSFNAKIVTGSFTYRQATSSTHNIDLGVPAKIVRAEMPSGSILTGATVPSAWVTPGDNADGYGWRLSQDGETLTYAHRGTGSSTEQKTADYTLAVWY